MTELTILQPVVALAAWTMVMWVWMYGTRLPASTQWKAHNYNHLHEAPTVFYAIALTLYLLGEGDERTAILGWAYVALRVLHSLVQAPVNKVIVRFAVFALSSAVLMALVALAARAVFLGATA